MRAVRQRNAAGRGQSDKSRCPAWASSSLSILLPVVIPTALPVRILLTDGAGSTTDDSGKEDTGVNWLGVILAILAAIAVVAVVIMLIPKRKN